MLFRSGRATDEVVAAAHQRLGLDQPLPVQFARFVWNALHGDLGVSIIQKAPVTEIVGERLEASVFLLTYSALIAVVLALPLALVAASHDDRADHLRAARDAWASIGRQDLIDELPDIEPPDAT